MLFLVCLGAAGWFAWEALRPQPKPVTHSPAKAIPIPTPVAPPKPKPLPIPVPALIPVPAPPAPATNALPPEPVPVVPAPAIPPQPAPTNATPARPLPAPTPAVPLPGAEFPRPAKDGLEAQIALARLALSPGCLDGAIGSQTRAALAAFQRRSQLPETGTLDTATRAQLTLDAPALTTYTVTDADLARLQPLGKTWVAKSQQTVLDYETILELVAEHAHAHPLLLRNLNPGLDWNRIAAGTAVTVPAVAYPEPPEKATLVIIHLAGKYLEAFGTESNLLAHFPCSIAKKVEKRPVGELHVAVVIPHPNYTFDPAIFAESPEAQAIGHKLIIPPGPNNPVGVAWIGLDRPGYGMHGTPSPEQVGRTESHGCFRLANWDAEYMVKLAWIGLPVEVVEQ